MEFRTRFVSFSLGCLATVVGVFFWAGCNGDKRGLDDGGESEMDPVTRRAERLLIDQQQNDQRIWFDEVEALDYERGLTELVDRLRFSGNRLETLKEVAVGDLSFRRPGATRSLDWGVQEIAFEGPWFKWDSEAWGAWMDRLASTNVSLDYFSLELVQFRPGTEETNGLDSAIVSLECHAKQTGVEGDAGVQYHVLDGELAITWDRPLSDAGSIGPIASISVEALRWRRLSGPQVFNEKRRYAVGDPEQREPVRITPVIVRDLDGDQRPEIVLGGVNLLLRNEGDFQFRDEAFLPEDLQLRRVGALADFTGDGHLDILGILPDGSPIFVEGGPGGTFTDRSRRPWDDRVSYPSALAIGDIDRDGDLDVWLAQHRPTYHGGMLPASLVDAKDGFPSRLYRNDGGGAFTEITGDANLGATRTRRTTGSVFLDFDQDGALDLLVTSDYAGVELHRNTGYGVFENVTTATFGQWHLSGLSCAVGLFDGDKQWDIFVGGRWSTAMHRLDELQLERADFPDLRTNGLQIASGNQLFLSQRQYETGPFNPDAKNTGWTNSAMPADFDNDGDDDLYLTTGHMTGRSVADFDSQFWRHDVFLSDGVPEEVLQTYFQTEAFTPKLTALRLGEISWYGYEPNRLQVNGDDGFVDLGYLHGVALSQDSPTAVAADLNNDGRMDLLTVAQRTFPSGGRLAVEQSLVIHENVHPAHGHWVGVHVVPNEPGFIAIGATVRLLGSFGVRERDVGPGSTAFVQGPVTAHFGLGEHDVVDHLVVRWRNGHEQVVVAPEVDRYHTISPRLDFTPIPDPAPIPEPTPDPEIESGPETESETQ